MDGPDEDESVTPLITFYCFSPRSMYECCDLPLPSPPPPLKPTPPGFLHASRLVDAMESLDTTSGGMVRKVLLKLKERSVEPFPLDDWLYYCEHCAKYTTHTTANHICHHCHAMDAHKSDACTKVRDRFCSFCASMATREPSAHSSADHLCFQCHARGQHLTCLLPEAPTKAFTQASSWFHRAPYCNFCEKTASHDTYMHVCRLCKQVGDHRSADCPRARAPCDFCAATSHSTAEHMCHHCKQVGDHRGLHCTHHSTHHSTPGFFPKKLTDMEAKLRWTLASMGLWSGGSQTPLTTPRHLSHPSPHAEPSTLSATTYVLSYMEGKSIVPARVLKYMRLLMHHDVPTNAFDVVVRIDIWEMKRPGMVSPQSFPATPRLRSTHHTRMNAYTESVLKGARVKLEGLIRQQYGEAALR